MNEVIIIGQEPWLWSEVKAVWSWLYHEEFKESKAHSWSDVPKHTRFCLSLNSKSRWMTLIQKKPQALLEILDKRCSECGDSIVGGSLGLCKRCYGRSRYVPRVKPMESIKFCKSKGCDGVLYAKELCFNCYRKQRYHKGVAA